MWWCVQCMYVHTEMVVYTVYVWRVLCGTMGTAFRHLYGKTARVWGLLFSHEWCQGRKDNTVLEAMESWVAWEPSYLRVHTYSLLTILTASSKASWLGLMYPGSLNLDHTNITHRKTLHTQKVRWIFQCCSRDIGTTWVEQGRVMWPRSCNWGMEQGGHTEWRHILSPLVIWLRVE